MRPRLLDLYSGAGGAAMGYHRAGFDVTGVDVETQPRYPFAFHQGDALPFLVAHFHEFDAIHASPPCQAFSTLNNLRPRRARATGSGAQLLQVRRILHTIGKPFIVENVPGAPMPDAITLCGVSFGLKVFRHRLFESSVGLLCPPHTSHGERRVGQDGWCSVAGKNSGGRILGGGHRGTAREWRLAMGIEWMTKAELSQAIPPAYTEFLGLQMLRSL